LLDLFLCRRDNPDNPAGGKNMAEYTKTIHAFRESLNSITESRPKVGVILGSGLSKIADSLSGETIDYSKIPGMPKPTVEGHRGFLKISRDFALLAGRFHYYEGHPIHDVVKPVLLLQALGVEQLLVTNAAGGINPDFSPGQIVLIRDHINLMGTNPLIGPDNGELGPRFPDMSDAYSRALRKRIIDTLDYPLTEGVYAGLSGPSYETPAEIRMLKQLGADMVGMSTVPEVIIANYLGIRTIGFSCITNMAAGILDQPLSHQEVIGTAARVENRFRSIVESVMELLTSE
jgi:purine-nucleoside phosphorylase